MKLAIPRAVAEDSTWTNTYRNDEAYGRNFDHGESREDRLYEIPVTCNTPYDMDRRPATLQQVRSANERLHHNDRAWVARNPPNDPGPYRAVVSVNEDKGYVYPATGLMYHPEGNSRAFTRAPIEPMDRRGHQVAQRHADDHDDSLNRVSTWPPRDEDGEDLADYETRYRKERGPRGRRVDKGRASKQPL
ncbi:hypothetical protein GGS23DRAFT_550893 [Durotheca rogersii]|uniref:uncharacterized protein n=1 Tax=Durotheca rogersii TaxID=419775 RepID=UPI0022206FE0|nr:uncharacterized protein GGS23DRAFT_550893 [Durotheca rogersii]KAI5866499.1 hypothetical protein GGS23DRAFT_550893 [Durotheca rogersii]